MAADFDHTEIRPPRKADAPNATRESLPGGESLKPGSRSVPAKVSASGPGMGRVVSSLQAVSREVGVDLSRR